MEVIGKGSYGVVRLGFRDDEGGVKTAFAVKSADKCSASSVEALENEIDILSSLSSPYIVEYYGEEETTSSRSMYMEYMPGGDVARGGKVGDVDVIRSYTWCIVMALSEVHKEKIVHCDVKGGNVLVGGSNGVAKLADFGSSFRVGGGREAKVVPRGSPLWMAPEVVRGESQSYESDVWSVGCTVIEMFTGMPPWQDNGVHTLWKIGYSDELPEYPAQLPDLARDFLDKCLVREPEKRWSCDQLLHHPFLIATPSVKVLDASPRSVLDWDNVNFSDEEGDDNHVSQDETDKVSARGRIGELATTSRINWESNGWIEVRNTSKKEDKHTVSVSVSVSVFEDEDEIRLSTTLTSGPSVEFHNVNDPTWINSSTEIIEAENIGGVDGHDGGSIRQQMITENNSVTSVTIELLFSSMFVFTLYSSTSIGHVPINVTKLLLMKLLMQIQCLWLKFISLLISKVFPFLMFKGVV